MALASAVSLYWRMIHSPAFGAVMLKAAASLVTSILTGLSRVPAVAVTSWAAMATGFISLSSTAMNNFPSFSVTSPCMVSLVLNSRMRPLFGPSSIAPWPKAKPAVRERRVMSSFVFIYVCFVWWFNGWLERPA